MDHISNLPDELLCHILSFLTTNKAVLTSILSKRWRNLFALVPHLDIDYSLCRHRFDYTRHSFMDFVDRVLALQSNSPIKKFSLRFGNRVDSDRVDAWVSKVLVRDVSELDLSILLDIRSVDKYHLPPNCFKNKKLATLKIGFGIDIGWLDGSVFLPMLKTLVLESLCLFVDKLESLLHALPVLEELVLARINWEDDDVGDVGGLIVSSASLKTLTIDIVYSGWLDSLSFDTPSLVYFSYYDDLAVDYSLVRMENLSEARITVSLDEEEIMRARLPSNDWLEDDVDNVLRLANMGKLMKGIRNVQYLNLSFDTVEVLSLCCEYMPVFSNLKTLTIKSEKSSGWQAMPVLLRNCPHLETLVLEGLLHRVTDKCGDACDCVSREDKGCSLTSCPIQVLKIRKFQGTIKEMHMIKHFLDYFPRLKEIKINMDENDFTQRKVLEISEVMAEKMELNNKSSSCDIQLMLCKKWTAQ